MIHSSFHHNNLSLNIKVLRFMVLLVLGSFSGHREVFQPAGVLEQVYSDNAFILVSIRTNTQITMVTYSISCKSNNVNVIHCGLRAKI